MAKDRLIRLGCWAAESALRFVLKVFDDLFAPLVHRKEEESMICFLERKRGGRAHTPLIGGNYSLIGGDIRVVCPSTHETRRSQLTIVVVGQETRSFKCRRPPLFNWGCGTRNSVFLGSSNMVKDKRTQHSDEVSQFNNHKHTQHSEDSQHHKFSTSRPSTPQIKKWGFLDSLLS